MSYISYFDLLGTKGFCEDKDIYYTNITLFYESVRSLSKFLKGHGRVGVFSDCAYAESNDLEYLLDFLIQVRNRLNAQGLFFNAFLKEGQLGVSSVVSDDQDELFGVVFKNHSIADLYVSQGNFKGVGICIDNSTKLISEINGLCRYKTIESFYIAKKKNDDGSTQFYPIKYYDIAYAQPVYGEKDIKDSLRIFFETFFSAYINSPKYGSYYISALINYLKSYSSGFKWDMSIKKFEKMPVPFGAALKMIDDNYEQIEKLPGIDYIPFVLLDIIYNSTDLDIEQKKSITMAFVELPSIKNKYINSLEDIPKVLFSKNSISNKSNREIFIDWCRKDFSKKYANSLIF